MREIQNSKTRSVYQVDFIFIFQLRLPDNKNKKILYAHRFLLHIMRPNLSTKNGSFPWQKIDRVEKLQRSDVTAPGKGKRLSSQKQILRLHERITVLKCHKPVLCARLRESMRV